MLKDIFIVSGARTPIGSFGGSLASLSATKLGSIAIEAAIERAGIDKSEVDEVYMGMVSQAGAGQAPARQASLFAGLDSSVICTTVNKVCSSGIKSIMLGSQNLMCGHQKVIVGGGMESLSNVPFYLLRGETKYGGMKLIDGVLFDGLTDVYDKVHMGDCIESLAKKMKISRDDQDKFTVLSYTRSNEAVMSGHHAKEIVPVHIKQKKGSTEIKEDEEYKRVNFDRIFKLPPIFQKKGGTVTIANTSTLNDAAAAMVLMSEDSIKDFKQCKPIARIIGFADAATAPVDFPVAPAFSINKLLKICGVPKEDVALWEINEAFSLVALANMQLLDLDPERVNVHGGAVSLGNPFAMSGARLVLHLAYALKKGEKGVAAICNGGGGSSSIMIEKL
ncbi:hypothetical protein AAG570_010850 [Ranatra chinensis]|uniref:Acetyl-CoA C-acetyltransferase n=1 Tax=Ranatra chinensis TaxID=642074 RepID=A0ABD0YV56_9HEMI